MKLKSTIIPIVAAIAMTTVDARANMLFDLYAGAFVSAGAATHFIDGNADTYAAQSFGAVFGLDIPVFRIELEYDYLNAEHSRMNAGMVNGYFKMPSTLVHPYLGVGMGATFAGRAPGDAQTKDSVAYQGMLGLTFDVPVLPLKVDGEVRALYAPGAYVVNDDNAHILHYDARLKLRYIF